MFTFAIITYNHESVIVEHLESIKIQVQLYGKGRQIYLIVSDDASTDRTIWKLEKWLEINSFLFTDVKIYLSESNQGIVRNYSRAVKAVQTDKFKVLAGDDLYYKNNIIDMKFEDDLVFTPIIRFHKTVVPTISWTTLFIFLNCNFKSMKKLYKYYNFILAPSVFIKRTIAQDEGMLRFVSRYKWLEDSAKWYYLFHEKENLKLSFEGEPKVLYRVSGGISTDSSHVKNTSFMQEREKKNKEWSLKVYRYPKYINPAKYYLKLLNLKIRFWDAKMDPELKQWQKKFEDEMENAKGYLKEIREKSCYFEKKLTEGEGIWSG